MNTMTSLDCLSASSYSLDEEEAEFFKAETGIHDNEELSVHIFAVQEKAYKVCSPLSIYSLQLDTQCWLKIAQLPGYEQLLKLGKECKGAIFLDIGCCFGNNTCKVIYDGFPIKGLIVSNLRRGKHNNPPTSLTPISPLSSQNTGILSPLPCSIIFSSHSAATIKGVRVRELAEQCEYRETFRHSPESWKEIWDRDVFEKGSVEVFMKLMEIQRGELRLGVGDGANGTTVNWLLWWVKRL
ncbi:hypothetical protein JAAARDRAFT_128232 [Jaapia argillacea MUCL 33604]|uniref:Uncharacterized protein n=1 Tax=Jaapia argillacea MUCL 33604 TaxID=933084 RepID=A0A067Q5V8_9AGAM|nr:hypothetical protein JAAARDRAFT_128232 [Jaapia argillacea MUCL 33604]